MARNKVVETRAKALVAELLVEGVGGRRENIRDLEDVLAELGELRFVSECLRRTAKRIGEARVEECRAAAD